MSLIENLKFILYMQIMIGKSHHFGNIVYTRSCCLIGIREKLLLKKMLSNRIYLEKLWSLNESYLTNCC